MKKFFNVNRKDEVTMNEILDFVEYELDDDNDDAQQNVDRIELILDFA
jgi:hypothetical protein